MQFRLRSPGEGAYRVHLAQIDGEEVAEALLAGESDEVRVDLPPGQYWARVSELGQSPEEASRFRLTLGASDESVELPAWRQRSSALTRSETSRSWIPAIRTARLARPSLLARPRSFDFVRQPDQKEPDNRYPLDIALDYERTLTSRLLLHGSGGRSLVTVSEPDVRGPGGDLTYPPIVMDFAYRTERDRVPFAVAISEDRSPDEKGSWSRPILTKIRSERSGDGFRFLIEAQPTPRPRRGFRARMTISIAGVPAIRIPIPMYAAGTVIEMRPIRTGEQLDFSIEITASDPRVQALVAALTELPGDEALKVLRWNADTGTSAAIQILADKRQDLWAATAAALLLVRTRQLEEVADWLQNLARLAPQIPDASIAAAWSTAAKASGGRRRTEKAVLAHLRRGLSIGAPTLSVANSLALEMLNALQQSAISNDVRLSARDLYVRVARRSRYRIYRGPYMLWEQPGERLQSGRLAGSRYLTLVHGDL